MIRIILFGEDAAHEDFLKPLLSRLGHEHGREVEIGSRSVIRGGSRSLKELADYTRDLKRGLEALPDILVVALDANCKGLQKRKLEILGEIPEDFRAFTVLAIPDPHIERWMLLDSAAFKKVFGKGCAAPDVKCERDRYKSLLRNAILATGITPIAGGMEFAEDILREMDFSKIHDKSLGDFLNDLEGQLKQKTKR